MNSLVNLSNTIENESAVSIQNINNLNGRFVSDLSSLQTALHTSLLSSNLKKIQKNTDCPSPNELAQLQNQLLTTNLNAGIFAFYQFLSISGSYRNKIHVMAEESLLALGDNNKVKFNR